MSAWIKDESPDSANDFNADLKYGFATFDSVVATPSLALKVSDGISHTLGVGIASGNFDFGGDLADNTRYGVNQAIRW